MLTLFAFSQENWQRPADEIEALMSLLEEYIAREMDRAPGAGVSGSGSSATSTGWPRAPARAVDRIMAATAGGDRPGAQHLHLLRLARRDRPGRPAARRGSAAGRLDPAEIDEEALARRLYTAPWPDPDLLIRTSGELRISNFLLWQLAYAELYVTPVLWPDFTRRHFFEAILDFQRRDRRFGRVPA